MRSKSALSGVKEIAKLANVSIGTVDRVLHNRKGVSEETRKKIEAIVAQLDYRPNKMASLLAKRDLITISVVIPKSSTETNYWTYPLAGIDQALSEIKQFGVVINYFFYDLNSKSDFFKIADAVLKTETNGVLLAPSFVEESTVFVKKLIETNVPFVCINSDLPKEESLSYIGPDLYQSGRLAAQLISFMMKDDDDILVINLSTQLELDHHLFRKEQGFRKYFEENNLLNTVLSLNINHSDIESIEKQIHKAIISTPKARVLFVTNSRVHIVAKVISKIKSDILLVGYDFIEENITQMEKGYIRFIISQRPREQGYMGIMALYKSIFKIEKVEPVNYMPIDIITRENYKSYKN
ncbi:LacI family DNA-binding transcriptional regulator [uncultured Mucilaginibacter sp.]|uniref:LacI family DNA-binding transcriptional regulator n=1 Tax=uncultured Mucilaginibacter sp. TaxID=797541 RepID=UPI0025FB4B7F|nr:LacI family DNA-binding transcriptional regulator [uncultured Mucilaginibacter sp.]